MLRILPPNSVIGRLGSSVSGPPQDIPFATLLAQLNGVTNVVGGPATSTVGDIPTFSNSVGSGLADSGVPITTLPYNVKSFGAKGDGVTDDTTAIQNAFNAVFELPNSLSNTPVPIEGILYFPPGQYNISSPITVTSMFGGRVLGAGRLASIIRQTSTGSCMVVNGGTAYTRWEGLSFWGGSSSSSVCFDLDGSGCQSNTLADCLFQGSQGAGIGIRLGQTAQTSENLILNCFIGNCSIAGVKVVGANALQNSMIGGDIQSCAGYGIWVSNGSMPNIAGVGFQNGTNTFDINVDNASGDGYAITGCRTESKNFAAFPHGAASIIGVNQQLATGTFVKSGNCAVSIVSCQAGGVLDGFAGSASASLFEVISSSFSNNPFCTNGVTGRFRNSFYNAGSAQEGTGTYVYDCYFKGDGTTNGMGEAEFTPNVAESCAHAFRCVFPSGGNFGFGIELLTEGFRRVSLDLDSSNNAELGFGPGSAGRDTFLNRQGVNNFGVGSSATAKDGTVTLTTLITAAVAVSALPAASGVEGARMMVNNSNAVASGNFGVIVAGTTGVNIVPVYSDGTNWRIG